MQLCILAVLDLLLCMFSSAFKELHPKSLPTSHGKYPRQSDKTSHSGTYFDANYFSTLNYDYLNGQTLLRVPKPLICESQSNPFGCKMYTNPVQMVNVSHLLATRLQFDYDKKEFPIYVMMALYDWIFISPDSHWSPFNAVPFPLKNKKSTLWFGQGTKPRTIYVDNFLIPYFVEAILPKISNRFVLYSGHNDYTVPFNIDNRWDYNSSRYQAAWDKLIVEEKVVHWFNENHVVSHPKVSTMPIGMNPRESHPDDVSDHPEKPLPLEKRPLMLLQLDKVRSGDQWVQRKDVHDLCISQPDICFAGGSGTTAPGRSAHKVFAEQVATYPFLLCVHGGGIDPSPKAWEAILIGTIPIIEHTTLDDAYAQLPVAFVRNITEFMSWENKTEVMRHWLTRLGPHYESGSKRRAEVLFKLTTKYWWGRVVSHLNHTIESYSAVKLE